MGIMDDRSIRTSRTTNPVTQCHISDDMNLLKHSCENLEPHTQILLTWHFSVDTVYCPENKMYILENNSTPFSQTNRRGTHSVSVSAQGILFYSFH